MRFFRLFGEKGDGKLFPDGEFPEDETCRVCYDCGEEIDFDRDSRYCFSCEELIEMEDSPKKGWFFWN